MFSYSSDSCDKDLGSKILISRRLTGSFQIDGIVLISGSHLLTASTLNWDIYPFAADSIASGPPEGFRLTKKKISILYRDEDTSEGGADESIISGLVTITEGFVDVIADEAIQAKMGELLEETLPG